MAWYAELRRRHWYCVNQWDAISWYRKYLYDTWYSSLTDEQKAKLEEQKRREKEKSDYELRTALMKLAAISGAMLGLTSGISNHEKYHGVYDENGFPIKHGK